MAKLTWVNCIHIYQPAWQTPDMVMRIANESYAFLIDKLERFPMYRMTLNIAGTLIESLESVGRTDLLKRLAQLHAQGGLELTGSSHYHAFLPQLPDTEVIRQIEMQDAALKRWFPEYRRDGFFLPELAYSPRLGSLLKTLGFRWIILDTISTADAPKPWVKYLSRRNGLAIVFRNRIVSKSYPPESIFSMLPVAHDTLIITATDGELYGHYHTDWQEHLKQVLESPEVETLTVGQYLDRATTTEPIRLRAASWETKTKQVHTNNPFSIWFNQSNPIHRGLWRLAHEAIQHVSAHADDPNFDWARRHLDRGLSSCSWWWASEMKTSPFAPLAWSPDEIEKGALELIKSIRSLQSLSGEAKLKAEKIYFDTLQRIWKKHWQTYGK